MCIGLLGITHSQEETIELPTITKPKPPVYRHFVNLFFDNLLHTALKHARRSLHLSLVLTAQLARRMTSACDPSMCRYLSCQSPKPLGGLCGSLCFHTKEYQGGLQNCLWIIQTPIFLNVSFEFLFIPNSGPKCNQGSLNFVGNFITFDGHFLQSSKQSETVCGGPRRFHVIMDDGDLGMVHFIRTEHPLQGFKFSYHIHGNGNTLKQRMLRLSMFDHFKPLPDIAYFIQKWTRKKWRYKSSFSKIIITVKNYTCHSLKSSMVVYDGPLEHFRIAYKKSCVDSTKDNPSDVFETSAFYALAVLEFMREDEKYPHFELTFVERGLIKDTIPKDKISRKNIASHTQVMRLSMPPTISYFHQLFIFEAPAEKSVVIGLTEITVMGYMGDEKCTYGGVIFFEEYTDKPSALICQSLNNASNITFTRSSATMYIYSYTSYIILDLKTFFSLVPQAI